MKIINLFFALLVSLPGIAQKNKNYFEKENLKGKVSVTIESGYGIVEKFGEIQKGSLSYKTIKKYNDIGNITEQEYYISNGNYPANTGNFKYIYDVNGNVTEKNNYEDGSLKDRYIYTYNEKGIIVEQNGYKADGEFFSKYKYKYDEAGNIKEESDYRWDGSLSGKSSYTYDDNGNMLEWNRHKPDGSFDFKSVNEYVEYDETGNWILKKVFEKDKLVTLSERVIEYY